MEQKEISEVYQALDGLEIRLEQTPELGTEYLRDRLLECREKQNTVTDLIVRVNRAYSAVRQRLRAQDTALRHAGTTEQAHRMREDRDAMLDEQDALKLLLDALNVRRGNLARTSSDIRLLDKIIEDKLRSGGQGGSRPQAVKPAPTTLPGVDPPPDGWLGPKPPTQGEVTQSVEQFVQNVRIIEEPHEIVVPPAIVTPVVATPAPAREPVLMLADDDEDIERFLES